MSCLKTSLLLLLFTCAEVHAVDAIRFEGEISRQSVDVFIEQFNDTDPETLVINSSGGEVDAAISLGLWVNKNGLNVVVDGVCLSSCANYVFTAGSHKKVTAGSVVAWHGNYHHLENTGLWRDDVELRMQRDGESRQVATQHVRKQVEYLLAREKMFFSTTGVNEYLCWVGKQPPHHIPDYFALSAKDMAHFGVNNVSLPVDYQAGIKRQTGYDIRFISLGNSD